MEFYEKPSLEDIEHYGVKGMKWGVRRYQPYPAGKRGTYLGDKVGAQPLKYKSKGAKAVKSFAINFGAYFLSSIIPGFGLAWNAAAINQQLKHNLDGRNYVNKDGEIEKISKLKKKTSKTDALTDAKEVNQYKNRSGGVNNCFCCTTTFEMRRRGYDVRARRRGCGTTTEEYAKCFKDVDFRNAREDRMRGESRKSWVTRSYNKLCNDIEKCPEGSRGFCSFLYEGMKSGHTISWEIKNGSVTFYDGQTGKTSVDECLSLSDQNYTWARLDNRKLNPEIASTCISRKDR